MRPVDPRAPGALGGTPFTGRPGGGVTGNLSEPAPGSNRPVSPPAFVGRPSVVQPAPATANLPAGAPPTVGRPSISEPASPRSVVREPGPVVNDSRQSGGQSFAPPPARSMPGARQSISEPAPQNQAPPTRPSAPVVREPARVLPQYNPGLSPGQSFSPAPAPRPTAPMVREPAPLVVTPPSAVQGPGPARQGVVQAPPVARPVEPQGMSAPSPAPVQRSQGPTSGGPNDGPPPRMRMQSEGAQR